MVVFGKKGLARQNRAPRPGVAPGQVTPGASPPAPGPVEVGASLRTLTWLCPSGGARSLGVPGGANTPGLLQQGRPSAFFAVQ